VAVFSITVDLPISGSKIRIKEGKMSLLAKYLKRRVKKN